MIQVLLRRCLLVGDTLENLQDEHEDLDNVQIQNQTEIWLVN